MIRTRHALLTALGAGVLALSACATPERPEGGYRIDNQNTVSPTLNTVRVIDGSLAQYKNRKNEVKTVLDVERVNISRSGTGFPQISVELRNKVEADIPLEVRTHWYDASGRPVDTPTSWTRVFARPMSLALYQQTSINPQATQYYVEVRGAQ